MKAVSLVIVATLLAITCIVVGRGTWRLHDSGNDAEHVEEPRTHSDPVRTEAGQRAVEEKRARLDARGAKPTDMPGKAARFFMEQRLAPGQTLLPLEQLHQSLLEVRARQSVLETLRKNGPALAGSVQGWTWLGPGNIGGRTRAIVIDPVSPNVMYAAGVAGGVWKSTDAGQTWTVTDDLMQNLAVCALAMDPTDPTTLYAGTGEGFYFSDTFVQGLGIFKSTDAGATWTQLSGTVTGVPDGAFHYVNKIRISPNDPTRLYAATRYGVWRSTDAGVTWSPVLANPRYHTPAGVQQTNGCQIGCTDLAIRNDRNPDALWAAFGSAESDGLYRSDDGGATWVQYTTAGYQGRMTIALAPSDNDRVYLVMVDNGGLASFGRLVSVYRSDDGVNFGSVLDFGHPFSQWLMSYVSIATGCFEYPYIPEQGWYDNIVAVDPLDPDRVWVGGINLYRSDDAGQTFGIAGYWFGSRVDPKPPDYLHPDQHEIVFHPDYDGAGNQTMYVGNDGGLFRTLNARAATSQEECAFTDSAGPPPDIVWETLNNGYGVTQYYHGDASRLTDRFVAGAQDNGTSGVDARNTPDAWRDLYGGDGGYVAIDPTDPDRFFVEIQGFPEIQLTVDGGDSFTVATNGITDTDGVFITPYAMDEDDPNIMWTGGSRPWRTTNGSALWEVAGPDFAGPDRISAIGIAPSDPNVVYLGFSNGYVTRTTDGLAVSPSWSIFTSGLQGGWVSSIAVDPQDVDTAYLTYSNYGIPHILKTVDGGTSWQSIDGVAATGVPDIPVHWIAVRPCNGQELYVGTELGVFASDDAGATWLPANSGLANVVVEALDFKDDDTLVAFTHGRGAFLTGLVPCATTGTPGADPVAAMHAHPNPFRSTTTMRTTLSERGPVRIAVFDIAGREVTGLLDAVRDAGPLEVTWDGRNGAGRSVAPGVYFLRVDGPGVRTTRKIVKTS